MASDDISLINRHLSELRQEVVDLRKVVEETALLEREATLGEVLEVLKPALQALVQHEADGATGSEHPVVVELRRAIPELGLTPIYEADEIVELWPDEAREDIVLDREVAKDAAVVKIRVKARGWARGLRVVVQPVGEVIEVIHETDE